MVLNYEDVLQIASACIILKNHELLQKQMVPPLETWNVAFEFVA